MGRGSFALIEQMIDPILGLAIADPVRVLVRRSPDGAADYEIKQSVDSALVRADIRLVRVSPMPGSLRRAGVAYLLRTYVRFAAQHAPALRKRRVTPHVMRHSCAVALLQAGIDVSVIRDYLDHVSVATSRLFGS